MIADLAFTSLETINCFDITTGAFLFTLDELQNCSLSQTEEKVDIVGKQGRKINSLKRNKAVTIEGTNGIVSAGLLAAQVGTTAVLKDTEVQWTDYLTVAENAAATKWVAIGTAGAEIEALYVRTNDGTLGTKLEQASTASTGKFAYDPSSKALSFAAADSLNGKEVVVFYKRKINANVVENKSDKYSSKVTMYIDAIAEDKCANIYRVQIYVPKADFSGEFTFDMGDNQTVQAFSADALAGGCGNSDAFWTYTIFGADTPDVTE